MTGPPNPPPPGPGKEAASTRKRRRRAPAGGAADDCFTCAKRGVKCDRKRPYCSQCLEIGNDCSGYKTQLTWGVGVASRGKLRGLSLPIAKSAPVQPQPQVKKSQTRGRTGSTASTSTAPWTEQDEPVAKQEELDIPSEGPPSATISHYNPYEQMSPHPHQHQHTFHQMSSPAHTQPEVVPQSPWGEIQFHTSMAESEGQRFQPMSLPSNGHGPMLSTSMDTISEVDYMSPISHSFPRDDNPFLQHQQHHQQHQHQQHQHQQHSQPMVFENYHPQSPPVDPSPIAAIMIEQPRPPTSCPSLLYGTSEPSSSSLHSHSHLENYGAAHLDHKMMQDCDSIARTPDLDIYSTSVQSSTPFWASSIPEEEPASSHGMADHSPHWPTSYIPQMLTVSPELIAKMPFFMDYYENTMCPSMVFIDNSENPFRNHVLQLAASSRSLQHAICALAACNLRMKRKLSLGQHGRDNIGEKRIDSVSDSMSDHAPPEDQSLTEEYQHRNLAVHLLNEQLNDTDKSRHDSVLATILLLCHYRMAESGVAKFQTQFAGVKKILGMRRLSPFPPSRDSAWMEAIFTYFDAISASINDREAQLSTQFYGVAPEANLLPPGAENLVGCDRELFKTISKLGRLNLLSQHRPVQQNMMDTNTSLTCRFARAQSPLESPLGNSYKPTRPPLSHQMSADAHMFSHHNRYDGHNRFASILSNDDVIMSSGDLQSPGPYDDHKTTFWREWKDARMALQSWEFDSQRAATGLSQGASSGLGAPGPLSPGAGLHSPALPGAHMHGHSMGSLNHHTSGQSGNNVTPSQVRDLGSLSEAFRYAALLYTERLASPNVPSSHSNFRNLVSQVVYYATSLEADSNAEKFLLWPLFVAGSECVNELQQNIVRSKCRDIMARSGYMNNLAALDILERLWAGDWREESKTMQLMRRGPFSWTKCISGPTVEVEWIMF